jgi:hypothetical protein
MPEVSAISAADRALEETGRSLFPFRFRTWLALGLVAFMDQCGRSGGTGGGSYNPGSLGKGGGGGSEGGGEAMDRGLAWLGEHALLAAGIAAVVITLVMALIAVVLWINSRGTFMYLDNVATRRSDVARPWREHADRAASYFAWRFGITLATFVGLVALLVPIAWSVFALFHHGAAPAPIALLVISALAMVAFLLALAVFSVLLRDFAAPIQWFDDVSCTVAIRQVVGLVRAQPLLFVVYMLLKLVFAFVLGIVGLATCCLTCCLGLLPVIFQTLLQPAFYFERRWSIELLQDLGYAIPAPAGPSGGLVVPPLSAPWTEPPASPPPPSDGPGF